MNIPIEWLAILNLLVSSGALGYLIRTEHRMATMESKLTILMGGITVTFTKVGDVPGTRGGS